METQHKKTTSNLEDKRISIATVRDTGKTMSLPTSEHFSFIAAVFDTGGYFLSIQISPRIS
jgi:hypothetical protein